MNIRQYFGFFLGTLLLASCTGEPKEIPICFRDVDIALSDSKDHIGSQLPEMTFELYDDGYEGVFIDEPELNNGRTIMSMYTAFNPENKLESISIYYLWYPHENASTVDQMIEALSNFELDCIYSTWEVLEEHQPSNLDKGQYEIFMAIDHYDEYAWVDPDPNSFEVKALPAIRLEYGVHYKYDWTYRARNKDR